MITTIEEVKEVAIELDFFELANRPDYFCVGLEELQAFAQHYIEVGRKEPASCLIVGLGITLKGDM